jgi:hypothetical protein
MSEPRAFQPFVGVHCETVATGTLLRAAGVELSEPMLFGVGEGLGFVYLNLATLPLPFLGGRPKPFELTLALCRNLGIPCRVSETSSKTKAWRELAAEIDRGRPVGLQVDCYYLDYFRNAPHFAGHFVAAYAYDDHAVRLVDTAPQGTLQSVPRASLEAARHAKGPMSARARLFVIEPARKTAPLAVAARAAIRANAATYLAPSFGGMSFLGIAKLAESLPTWLTRAASPAADLAQAAALMERAGTGGGLFRNLYRDFLAEAAELLPAAKARSVKAAHGLVAEAAKGWEHVARLIERAGEEGDPAHLRGAATACREIAELERSAMQGLRDL